MRRARSNTPLQALTTLNEPIFVESAQALAKRALLEGGGNDTARIAFAFRLCTARAPDDAETQVLLEMLQKEERRIAEGWVSALEISGMRGGSGASGLTPTRVAAFTAVARVILNLDETITKE